MIQNFEKFINLLNEDGYAATGANTNGMGNVETPRDGKTGSGDKFDDEEDDDLEHVKESIKEVANFTNSLISLIEEWSSDIDKSTMIKISTAMIKKYNNN